jgi:hypothetical protein
MLASDEAESERGQETVAGEIAVLTVTRDSCG